MGEGMAAKLDRPLFARLTAWIGVFGFMVGLASFLITRMWFDKAIDDFNKGVIAQGKGAPELIAAAGNGFTSTFYLSPLSFILSPDQPFLQWCGSLMHSTQSLLWHRWLRSTFMHPRVKCKGCKSSALFRVYLDLARLPIT